MVGSAFRVWTPIPVPKESSIPYGTKLLFERQIGALLAFEHLGLEGYAQVKIERFSQWPCIGIENRYIVDDIAERL